MRTARARVGFTLVELLVVIAIIAVLIALLLPALSGARRQAQITHCLAIQRQIGIGATMHAQAHQGYYPIAGNFDLPPTASVASPEALGDANRLKYTYVRLEERYLTGFTLAPWQAAIATHMGRRAADTMSDAEVLEEELGAQPYLRFFICPAHADNPADIPPSIIYISPSLGWLMTQSYVVNEAVLGVNDSLGRLRGKASAIRRPAQTMMLMDGLASLPRIRTWIDPGTQWVTLINKTPTPPVRLSDAFLGNDRAGDPTNFDRQRHKGRVNVLFFDGHAETLHMATSSLQSVYLLPD